MAGKKGYKATRRMRERDAAKKGGNEAGDWPDAGNSDPGSLAAEALRYLEWLAVRNYTPDTIEGRRDALKFFLLWAHERELHNPDTITKPILESYQRHLWRYRKANGKPLGTSTQRGRLGTLKDYFAWLTRQNTLLANPASEIELPRPEKRLPVEALSIEQINAVLNVPDVSDPLGIRDRAMLETFYSTAMRRSELARLAFTDLNRDRQTIRVHGKGRKERVVPIGERALAWLIRYLDEVRPRLVLDNAEHALFLTSYGEAFNPDVLSRMVTQFIKKADIDRTGSCHLIRHTCATQMHDNGADIRFIQQLFFFNDTATTEIYTEVSINQLREVHARTHPAESPKSPKPPQEEAPES